MSLEPPFLRKVSLVRERIEDPDAYPEAALSPSRQLALLTRMHELLEDGSQLIIATHAPIVLAYPGATIYRLDDQGIRSVEYEETEHVQLTRNFLNCRERFLERVLAGPPAEDPGVRPQPGATGPGHDPSAEGG